MRKKYNGLKEFKEVSGLSYAKLGKMFDVSRVTVYYIATGKRRPSFELSKKISRMLGIKVEDLLTAPGYKSKRMERYK